MVVTFYLMYVNGEKAEDLLKYEDEIFEMFAHITDENDEATVGEGWVSLSRIPTIEEILFMTKELAKLGLVIAV